MGEQRIDPPEQAGEREMLIAWLDWHRATLRMKCDGLSADQLCERAAPPSTMSLLGLVRHMADVERTWFRRGVIAERIPPQFYALNPDGGTDDGAFDDVHPAGLDEAFAAWTAECERSREIVAGVESLDQTFVRHDTTFSVRWVLVHMIEEYARHNGHADLLRERIDGVTGE